MTCAARVRRATAKPSHDGRAGKLPLKSATKTRRQRRLARTRLSGASTFQIKKPGHEDRVNDVLDTLRLKARELTLHPVWSNFNLTWCINYFEH